MRADLQGILQKGETVLYDADEPENSKRNSIFGAEVALFLLFGSFFIVAVICAFVFSLGNGDSLTSISAKSLAAIFCLGIVCVVIGHAHNTIAKNLKLTSVIITEKRLFMAPPAAYVLNVGWEGPKEIADVVFADQLSVVRGTLSGSPCLIFTSLNPFFKKVADEHLPLQKRYIPVANVDEAFDSLPVFLKSADMQFDDSIAETPHPQYDRAVSFLASRKARLGQDNP